MKKIILLSAIIIILIGAFGIFWHGRADNLSDYGINNLEEVKMSYKYDGTESPFDYILVEIKGDGNAVCIFKYQGDLLEQRSQLHLNESFIKDFIKQYVKLDFFKFNYEQVIEPFAHDAGQTTLVYQFKEKNRSVSYAAIKTKTENHSSAAAIYEGKFLAVLHNMYWKIISQQEYSYNLSRYRSMDKGELANLFSGLKADVSSRMVLEPEKFLPIIMEIISQKEFSNSIGQYAVPVLEKITGEKLAGKWWDCQKWVDWWQENKDKYEKN